MGVKLINKFLGTIVTIEMGRHVSTLSLSGHLSLSSAAAVDDSKHGRGYTTMVTYGTTMVYGTTTIDIPNIFRYRGHIIGVVYPFRDVRWTFETTTNITSVDCKASMLGGPSAPLGELTELGWLHRIVVRAWEFTRAQLNQRGSDSLGHNE